MTDKTIHGCAVTCGRHGILIIGPSGSGKSSLAHEMVRQDERVIWITDDQVQLSVINQALIARAPATIRGQAERTWFGIEQVKSLAATRLDLAVQLTPIVDLERLPAPAFVLPLQNGPKLPAIKVPVKALSISVPMVFSALDQL